MLCFHITIAEHFVLLTTAMIYLHEFDIANLSLRGLEVDLFLPFQQLVIRLLIVILHYVIDALGCGCMRILPYKHWSYHRVSWMKGSVVLCKTVYQVKCIKFG